MIRIAIVEDEDSYVQVLTGYLKQYETEHSLSFQISVFHDGLDIVSEYKADYDIILLDIQMKHLDGMKTAEKIRELDEDVSFIFITSTIQFAVQGYLVDALGYVVKPVAYLAFSQILGKAVKKVKQKQQKDYMTIEVEGRTGCRHPIQQGRYKSGECPSVRLNSSVYTDYIISQSFQKHFLFCTADRKCRGIR